MSKIPEITQDVIDEAKRNPGGWVYKVDWNYSPDQYTPPEAIIGGFEVDPNGNLTGHFEANPNYRAVKIASRPPREYMVKSLGSYEKSKWTTEMDPAFDHLFPEVPPEGFTGDWYIGPDGKYTGQFRPNPHYTGSIKT
jgi:hypothetical protein